MRVSSRELHYFGSARVPELSRDVRYLLVSSLAHEPIEPLKWGMAQNHIGSYSVLWKVWTLDTCKDSEIVGLALILENKWAETVCDLDRMTLRCMF